MDAWSAEQLQRMQLGGNDALNAFLKNYGVDKYTDIRDKYNSQAAEVTLSSWRNPCIYVRCDKPLLHAYMQSYQPNTHCSFIETKLELRWREEITHLQPHQHQTAPPAGPQ